MFVKNSVSVRVLLISRRTQVIETLRHLMQQTSMDVELCGDLKSVQTTLFHDKFDGVLMDCNEKEEAFDLLKRLRQLTSHRGAVVCAIVAGSDKTAAFQAGANFVLEEPLSASSIGRTLKAAYPLMVRERRRYFRCPVQAPTFVIKGLHQEFVASSINISESGIAITSPTPVQVGDKLQLRLRLPGNSEYVKMAGEVCSTDATGRTGIHFSVLPSTVAEQLRSWLSERMQEWMAATDSETVHGRLSPSVVRPL